jgi:GAF domain-containing protein
MSKQSLFWIVLGGVLLAGIPALAVLAAWTGDVLPAGVGLVVLIVVGGGAAAWITRQINAPVRHITQIADDIRAAARAETVEDIMPNLAHLREIQGPPAVMQLAKTLEQMVVVLDQRLSELNSVYAMGQAITAKVDFEQTVEAVLAAVQQVVVFDAAEVTVLRGNKLVVEAWVGQEDFNNTTGREYRIGRGPTGMIASNKQPVLVSTISGEEEDLKRTLGYESAAGEFLAKTHKVVINSFLGIPLLINDRLIGTLTLVHREPGRFTESDRRQLNKLAAQASIAIDNAIQVRQREDMLKAQIRELRIEVDQSQLDEEVEQITTSDYFQHLQSSAKDIRQRSRRRRVANQSSSEPDTNEKGE